MVFDLRTCDSAYDFVLEFMGMTSREFFQNYYVDSNKDFEDFWGNNNPRIKKANISDLRIMGFHVLGSLDDCEEIKTKGLWNLQKVLGNDTMLSRMLKKEGIIFNISDKLLYCGKTKYDIDYDHYKNKEFLTETEIILDTISHRVFYDYCINGFLVCDNIFDYGTQIHERPEFLMRLSELLPGAQKIEEYWKAHSISYKVNFYVTVDQVQRFNFELDEQNDPPYDGWFYLDEEMKIKKWLLNHAINRAYDELHQEYLYLKDSVIVPSEQIMSYEKI